MVSSVLANAILNQKAPDILGSFREGQQYVRGEKAKELSGKLLSGRGDQNDYSELAELDPEIAFALGESINAKSASDLNAFIRDTSILERMLKTGQNQAALNFTQQSIRTGQMAGRDTTQAQAILDKMQRGEWDTVAQEVNAFTGSVNQSKLMTVGKDQVVIDQYGNEVYARSQSETDDGDLSDVAKDLIKQRDLLGKTARVINTNYSKIENLAKEVKNNNRSAVAQLGVALVKLGDPTSVVKEEELRQAFAFEDGGAKLAELVETGQLDRGVVGSILQQLDPLNPKNINVANILTTADALVASQIPSLRAQYGQFKDLLSLRPEKVQRNIFTKSFGDYFDQTMALGGNRRSNQGNPNATPEVLNPNAPELVDF